MSEREIRCSDIERLLIEELENTLPPQIREHVNHCERCRKLVDTFAAAALTQPPSTETLNLIQQRIIADLKPVKPLMPAFAIAAIFMAILMAVVFFSVSWMGAFGFAAMSRLQASVILGLLVLNVGFAARSLADQMAPGSLHRISPGFLPGLILIALSIAIGALFHFREDRHFWTNAWVCLSVGTLIGLLTAIPLWAVLRRGANLSSGMTGIAAGLLAGLAGTTVLEIHCPNLDAWHILTSHLGALLLCMLAGFVLGSFAKVARWK